MFHISSGDGTPEVVQDKSTFSPSINVTLDGFNVAMGTSTYNQGVEKKGGGGCRGGERERERERERGGGREREREGSKLHGQLFSVETQGT